MGLEEFTDDYSSSSSSSSSKSSKSKTGYRDNSPSVFRQRFSDDSEVNARAIRFQIRSWNGNWSTQYSRLRFEEGELVLYSSALTVTHGTETLAVFTTIENLDRNPIDEPNQPIWIVPWDLEKSNNIGEGTYVEFGSSWQEELYETVGDYLQNFKDKLEE